MTKNRFSKPVAFNNTNPSDQEILKHVKRRNFSGYVKKLILADMAKNNKEVTPSKLEQLQEKLKRSTDNVNSDSGNNADT